MVAAANVQTYFCLLFAPRISESAPKGGPDIHVVTIVFVEAEERTAQNVFAINTKYQSGLLVDLGNNTIEVHQDRRDLEDFQDCRRPAIFTNIGCGIHRGNLTRCQRHPGVCAGSRPSVYSGGNVILFVDAAARLDSEHWTRRLAQEPFRQAYPNSLEESVVRPSYHHNEVDIQLSSKLQDGLVEDTEMNFASALWIQGDRTLC